MAPHLDLVFLMAWGTYVSAVQCTEKDLARMMLLGIVLQCNLVYVGDA